MSRHVVLDLGLALLLISFSGCNSGHPLAPAASTAPSTTQAADNLEDPWPPEDEAVLEKLQRKITEPPFENAALAAVIAQLQTDGNVPIKVDWAALKQAGVTQSSRVTVRIRDLKFSKAVHIVLQSVDLGDEEDRLTWRVGGGAMEITTSKVIRESVVVERYDISDFLAGASAKVPIDDPAGRATLPESDRSVRIDELKKYIEDNVDTNSWKDNGGDLGEIKTGADETSLAISQTPASHRKIRWVLKSLRASNNMPAVPQHNG
jgi:hypothetical protein